MPGEKLWKSPGGMHTSAASPHEMTVATAQAKAPRATRLRSRHHISASEHATAPASTAPARLVHASKTSMTEANRQRGRGRPSLASAVTSRSTPGPYDRLMTEYSTAQK